MEIQFTESSQSPYVIEATDADFQEKVIDASHQTPMLVDFWAPWCGPCKTLGPLLEKLADEYGGRFTLVKVNMDENPMLAQALRIQSIPNVKLVVNGALQDEFAGAYPEPEVRRFLDHHLPSEADREAMQGIKQMDSGDLESAVERFKQTLAEDPKNAVALVGLGNYYIDQGDLEQAKTMERGVSEVELDRLPDQKSIERDLGELRAKIFLTEHAGDAAQAAARLEANGEDLQARLQLACAQGLQGQFEPALEHLLYIVKRDRKFQDDAGRKGMIAVFALLPPESPLDGEYRQKLSSLLFA